MSHYSGSVPDLEPARTWLTQAACRANDIDPDWFYPDNDVTGIERAREICKACPVIRACLADCLQFEGGRASSNRFGVYAGLTPRQRYRLNERRRDQAKRQQAAA